ncbi:sugar kinase [Oceanivirga salmonicida]|uniref:sugar kinase n=1 Tax=Oceanivirga salmonicida TaxID=1769291 RepID=UPI00082BE04D|nr:sugar kinase [Oceanivirga salmonicida]
MKKILLLGEAMCLLICKEYGLLEDAEKFERGISGAELNVAIGLKRLGYDIEYVTKLGNDPFGKNILKFLKKEKVGTKYIKFDEENKTGIQLKSKTKKGDPDIYYFRKNSAASTIDTEYIKDINLKNFDLIHITGIPLAISESFRQAIYTLIDRAKKEDKFITFDPNLRSQMWNSKEEMIKVINEVSKKVDLVLPGIEECKILVGSNDIKVIENKYKDMGINRFIIKEGEKGSHSFDNGIHIFKKGFKVSKVIDTVGAGDGFAVGIISSILESLNTDDMLERANAIGAIQVSNVSDNAGLPTRVELEKYIFKNRNVKKGDYL